jgi:hypothetical protein
VLPDEADALERRLLGVADPEADGLST